MIKTLGEKAKEKDKKNNETMNKINKKKKQTKKCII